MTTEKWVVTHDQYHYRREFDDEMVALSHAKDMIARERERGREWHSDVEQYPVRVLKVVYESRRCNEQEPDFEQAKQGIVFLCDYQMFPLEEPDPETPVLDVARFYDSVEIPCARRVLFEEEFSRFVEAVAAKKEAVAWAAVLAKMPAERVSALGINEIRWYDEDMPCEDGFLRWRAKGPRVFGKLTLLDEEPGPWEDDDE